MNIDDLQRILKCGEDSSHQFKQNISNPDSLAADMVAFSNGIGGKMLIGVNDDGGIEGLTSQDIKRINQLISNTASQVVKPAINPISENIHTENGIVIVVTIPEGVDKPYQDKDGVFWVKSGADKRKATSRGEIRKIFQKAGLLPAETTTVVDTNISDIAIDYFSFFFRTRYKKELTKESLDLQIILENMKLSKDNHLTVVGALLFAKHPEYSLPVFIVKAILFMGYDNVAANYLDKREIVGRISDVYQNTVNFIISCIHHVQGDQGFNSLGIPEIPLDTLQELVTNALIHRDYSISAPVRVFIFRNRIEIISPGHLPNNLKVENIKHGVSNARNPVLASFASYLLPYSGVGSGITKALQNYPDIDFEDNRELEQFKVTIWRKEIV